MSKFLLSVLSLFLSFHVFAATIKGTVVDNKNGTPLVGVIVTFKSTDTVNGPKGGAVTDIDGKYEITLKEGDYTLLFNYFSFTAETVITVNWLVR